MCPSMKQSKHINPCIEHIMLQHTNYNFLWCVSHYPYLQILRNPILGWFVNKWVEPTRSGINHSIFYNYLIQTHNSNICPRKSNSWQKSLHFRRRPSANSRRSLNTRIRARARTSNVTPLNRAKPNRICDTFLGMIQHSIFKYIHQETRLQQQWYWPIWEYVL